MRLRNDRIMVPALLILLSLAACQRSAGTSDSAGASPSHPVQHGDTATGASPGSVPPAGDPNVPAVRGIVTGRILAADGTPVTGVVVTPRSLDVPAQPVPEMAVVTDARGAYTWSLAPGRYELDITPPSGTNPSGAGLSPGTVIPPTGRRIISITAGGSITLDLTLG
jgi:hypothetical protein